MSAAATRASPYHRRNSPSGPNPNQSYHMTDMYVSGPDAFKLLEKLGVNSFNGFEVNKAKRYVRGA